MRGYLSLQSQTISAVALQTPVHGHRASLLDLASRDMEDEGEAKESSKKDLKAAKLEFGTLKEKIRAQPFQASQKSLFDQMAQIESFTKNPYYRSAVKNGIRDTNKHTHEWIPCQLMADCLIRDSLMGLNPGAWLLMQVHLRTATSGLIFDPQIVGVLMNAKDRTLTGHALRQPTTFGLSKLYKDLMGTWQAGPLQPGDQCFVLQGHEGAMRAGTTLENYSPDALDTQGWLSYGSSEFHSQLLYCFDRYGDTSSIPGDIPQRKALVIHNAKAYLRDLFRVAERWMWNPNDVPPGSQGLALPFKGYIGKGKERKEFTVDENNYVPWLSYCVDTKKETLEAFELCAGTLDKVYG
jgi:hypothetical protein